MSAELAHAEAAPGGPGSALSRWMLRFAVWARRMHLADTLALALAVGAVVSGFATYAALTDWGPGGPNSKTVLVLLNIDLFLMLCLALLVARKLVRLWTAHRAGAAGSRLHVRLAALFGFVAIVPAILMATFSALFFTFGVQTWFGDRVRTALTESAHVARAYLAEHQQVIRGDVLGVANDINRQWPQLSRDPQVLTNFLSTQAAFRSLTEAVIFTADWQVIAKTGYTFALQSGEQIPLQAIAQANLGDVAVVTGESSDRVRALVKLESYPAAYLYVGRFVDRNVLGHVVSADAAVNEYLRLEGSQSTLEISFTLLFSVVALLLLMVSVWFGLTLATRLAKPVSDLINAAERVRGGDLTVRVDEIAASDEIATLSRAFNRMTLRLDEQRTALRETNAQLDERRRFTETVLGGVTAGVIGLDPEGRITLPNRSASDLLGADLVRAVGQPMLDFAPEFAALLNEIREAPAQPLQREVQVTRNARTQVFLVRMTAEQEGNLVRGYVVTFDDITALQAAQRQAAWADVARRIAHEIKNPLTPIQLSAERLRRKYMERLGDDSGLLSQCTDTIIRHVGDIGHMVDEFSAFARLPTPVMATADLKSVIDAAVILQRTAYPHIALVVDAPTEPLALRCDARQLGQALTNVIKNAVEAVESRIAAATGPEPVRGRVVIGVERDASGTRVCISDNGIGLPSAERHRLTEPYVTTRAKGTGLGLAIVRKILEDHGGRLTLDNVAEQGASGAQVAFHFPATLTVDVPVSGAHLRTVRA